MDPSVPSIAASAYRADLPSHLRTQNGPAPAASTASSTTSLPNGRSFGSPLTQPTSQAGVKKKRVPACDTCNSKKIKCDGVRPNCGMCSKNGRTCSYERLAESNRGKRPRTDDASDVVQNPSTPMNPAAVAQAVAVVPPVVQPSQHRSPATQQSFPNLMPSALQLVGQSHLPSSQSVQANVPILNSSIGNASTYQNQQAAVSSRIAPFAVLPSSRIGTSASQIMAAQQNTPSRPNHIQVGSVSSASNALLRGVQNSISQSNFSSLPAALVHANQYPLTKPPDPLASLPQEAKNDLIGLYFKYIDPMMPILHKQSFHNSKEAESPLLLHTIYAMAARYCKQPAVLAIGALYGSSANGSASTTMEELRSRACDAFYFKARDLVDQYMDFPRVSTIAAFCLLKCLCAGKYASIVGTISSFSIGLDVSGRLYKQKIDELKEYMRWKGLDPVTRRKVIKYYEIKYRGKFFEELISKVPFLNRKMHDGRDELFLGRIATALTTSYYVPGDIIISAGDMGFEMFFILKGSVNVVVGGSVVGRLQEGSFFGELALIANIPRTATIQAAATCVVYVLARKDFEKILPEYEDVRNGLDVIYLERMARVKQEEELRKAREL
ncbi:hypothetical protein CcCBS67573_g04386 [Chytriomyces confervae]|uniref:Cyclic nucleotide-binding domain-containing protein n=1 Tax=Chytriomyces confervae TaxID=246404 RepID=A0A507FDQ5_9FUNG|nr:hypothetical protein CcCBS67573_g04386 [Chytriomyces confervae]